MEGEYDLSQGPQENQDENIEKEKEIGLGSIIP